MNKPLVAAVAIGLLSLSLVSCRTDCPTDDICRQVDRNNARRDQIESEIKNKGYALVGKTPDGRPLYLEQIDRGGWTEDVYFTNTSITARENCGKNCVKSVTSIND